MNKNRSLVKIENKKEVSYKINKKIDKIQSKIYEI